LHIGCKLQLSYACLGLHVALVYNGFVWYSSSLNIAQNRTETVLEKNNMLTKRNQLIASGKMGHRVLLFGEHVFGNDASLIKKHKHAQIDAFTINDYNKLKRLTDYTLVILDYAPFLESSDAAVKKLNVLEKMMQESLNMGTTFCFVHCDESVPRYNQFGHNTGFMLNEDIINCKKYQLGFRWLYSFSIRPNRLSGPVVRAEIGRNEFRPFLKKWGASHNYFTSFGKRHFSDIIYGPEVHPLGFSLNFGPGRIIFLPFQRDSSRPEDLAEGVHALLDSLLTYITKSLKELPSWAEEPYFDEEKTIKEQCQEFKYKLAEQEKLLEPFSEAKMLLFQAEYTLEQTVPKFIEEHIGLQTLRMEEFKEDFWILDESNEKAVICEVKSYVKGFKKSGIFSLFNHRETNNLGETFPSVLVVNANLQAGSWEQKVRLIDKQDYVVAAQNHILIVRVEDLIWLWDGVRQGILTKEEVFKALTTFIGWLNVNSSGQIKEFR